MSSSSSNNNSFTPAVKKAMENPQHKGRQNRNTHGSQICTDVRNILYETTHLGEKLRNQNNNEIYNFIKERYEYFFSSDKPIVPNRRCLRYTTEQLVNEGRTKLEKAVGQKTSGQCDSSILPYENKKNTIVLDEIWNPNNFRTWERKNCWLCGHPLKNNIVNNTLKTPDCEHKLAMLLMMLIAAGLKRPKPKKSALDDSTNAKKSTGLYYENLPAVWKLLVRSEGYAWSHTYCNQFKSQIPFMNVKKIGARKYEYVIEINNIVQYLGAMFELTDDEIKQISELKIPNENFVKDEGSNPKSKLKSWKEQYDNMRRGWKQNNGITDDNKLEKAKKAFKNIINMLIPTYVLLNIGDDVPLKTKNYCKKLLQSPENLSDRTFVNQMNSHSIASRLRDNRTRILGWIQKKLVKKKDGQDKIKKIKEGTLFKNIEDPHIVLEKNIKQPESFQDLLDLFLGESRVSRLISDDDNPDNITNEIFNLSQNIERDGDGRFKEAAERYNSDLASISERGTKRSIAQQFKTPPRWKPGGRRTRRRRKNKKKRSKRKKKRKRTKKKRKRRRKITRKRKSK